MRLQPVPARGGAETAGRSGHAVGIGGRLLAWRAWAASGPRGAIVLSHGLHEHGGRYDELAGALGARGFALWSLDQHGHGRSEGPSGHVARLADCAADLRAFAEAVARREPGPLFLVGHSLGGVVALRMLQDSERPTPFRGLILSSAALRVRDLGPRRSALLGSVAGLAPRLGVARIRGDDLSALPARRRAIERDPRMRHGPVRAVTLHELDRGGAAARAALERVRIPALVLHGDADPLVPADASRALAAGLGSADVTLRLYEGGRHELLFDRVREQVLEDLLAWLEARR